MRFLLHLLPIPLSKKPFGKNLFFVILQLIRVQSADGTKRVEVSPGASLLELYESIQKVFQLEDPQFAVYKERNYTQEVSYMYAAQFIVDVAHACNSCSHVVAGYFQTDFARHSKNRIAK